MDESKPLKWRVNDRCMAPYSEDQLEYEAEIKEILVDESGCSYALIEFIGYDQEETVWLDDLKPIVDLTGEIKEHNVPSIDSHSMIHEAVEIQCETEKDHHVGMDSGLEEGEEEVGTSQLEEDTQDKSPSEVVVNPPPTVDELISLSDLKEENAASSLPLPSASPNVEAHKSVHSQHEFIEKLISLNLMEENKTVDVVRSQGNYINDLIHVGKDDVSNNNTSECHQRDDEMLRTDSKNQELKQEVNTLIERLEEVGERIREFELKNEKMNEKMKSLTDCMNVFTLNIEERIASFKDKFQEFELQLTEFIQSSQKKHIENGGTKDHSDDDKDDVNFSKSKVSSTTLHIESLLKREENQVLLIDHGPINVGRYLMQPVLCYFPILDKSEVALLQGKMNGSSKGSNGIASTSLKTPSSEVVQLWKSQEGSQKLIKLLEDDRTPLDTIIDIFDNVKAELLDLCIHEWGHKVIISLLSVSPRSISQSIKSALWTGLSQCMKSRFGATTLIQSLKGITASDQLLGKVEKALVDYGVLDLMVHEEGYRVVTAVIDWFKPAFVLETISKNILKLAVDKKGCIVLSKALSLYEHSQILSFVEVITQNANFINANSPQAASIFGGILENHLASGMLVKDSCIDNLRPVLSSDIKISLRKLLNTSSVGSNWFSAP